jgi:ferric-dicitrate binding protein FerR (iron transport regulator)
MNGTGKSPENYQIEDFVTDESFINFFFQLNPRDIAFWESWILSHPENARQFEAAKQMLRNLSLSISEEERDQELSKLKKAIGDENFQDLKNIPSISKPLQWKKTRRRKFARLLLPFLLLLAVAVYLLTNYFPNHPDQFLVKSNDSSKPIVITLSDGTIVTLAPQSVFRYPAEFGTKERKVYLEGEAQFHVSRDAAHPFKVYQGNIIATVLGTVFNVKKQAGDSVLLVELIEGKLKVEAGNDEGQPAQSIILNPDERAMYNSNNKNLHKEIWKSQPDLLRTMQKVLFRHDNFEEIASQIKTDFGIILINKSNKKDWRFTGEFTNATAKEIIDNICLVEGLSSQMNGDSILIKSLP